MSDWDHYDIWSERNSDDDVASHFAGKTFTRVVAETGEENWRSSSNDAITFYGTSNGYYSESVDLWRLVP